MRFILLCAFSFFAFPALPQDFAISKFSLKDFRLSVTNAFSNGVVTVEAAPSLNGPWVAVKNAFSLASEVQLQLQPLEDDGFYRALMVDLTDFDGVDNLFQSYGDLSTVAGSGNITCISCYSWNSNFEGGFATNAALSSPHITMADRAGNLYIADKRAHAIRKVTLDGRIHTVAGTSIGGYGDTNPAPATTIQLNNPNGLYVFENGTFYILDRDNGLIRKVDTNGIMTTIVNNGSPITGGRGLWVSPDESFLFFSAGSVLKLWDTSNGLTAFASGFSDLGNIAMDADGHMVVTDARLNRVYRIEDDGTKTVLAGNGNSFGGGDGALATDTALFQVRGIWIPPCGGYFLSTDAACQLWYVDIYGVIHLVLNGSSGSHAGDGAWFYDSSDVPKISNGKQITMDYDGNLILTESEYGYVRKIQFLRHGP
ncbi:MAG TPA: hypothetical protein VGE41_07280 [Verrucomicrobiae bacterium]